MARIKIILEDDNGAVLTSETLSYALDLKSGNFHTLEGEVEHFKKRASKEVMSILLQELQKQHSAEKKKKVGT